MRAGVLAAIGGTVAILVATGPALAFNSGVNPDTYFGPPLSAIDDHREWASEVEGVAYASPHQFTRRLPDDEFDSILLSMINGFRSDNGLPPFAESEGLRAQSAIWANTIADQKNHQAVDWWAGKDIDVACRTVTDLYSTSAVSGGRPGDVFDEWAATPAVRNALLAPGPAWAGIASVVDEGEWTNIRIVHGDCSAGTPLPYVAERSPLPKPEISVKVAPLARTVSITVDRLGGDQLWVDLQRHDGEHWVNERPVFPVPGAASDPVVVGAGQYRVFVGEQGGYAAAFTEPITIN